MGFLRPTTSSKRHPTQSVSSPTAMPERRPRGGTHSKPLRLLSWNAGHVGVQQWAEVKAWLHTKASETCDILASQETHWNETAEFTVEGWQCVSSAKTGAPRAPKGKAKPRHRRRSQNPAPQEESAAASTAKPANAQHSAHVAALAAD